MGLPDPITALIESPSMKTCSFNGCDRVTRANGLCEAHNHQRRMGNELRPIGQQRRRSDTVRQVRQHPMDLALALVELSSGHWAVIDAADAPAVGRFNWFAKVFRHTTYGWRRITGDSRGISLHRFIGTLMGLELTATVDHENGNGLDCRRSNLRDATAAQQRQNTSAHGDSWTGIKGVTWNKRRGLWRARITQDGRTHELGYFTTSDEAAQAYAHAAATMFGEFASTRTAH